jgi:putative Ca2+/H+ antiporter (TMEM165/GDT1 family)
MFDVLVLFLMLVLAVMAGLFYAEGNPSVCGAFIVAVGALAFGLWHLNRRKGVRASPRKRP